MTQKSKQLLLGLVALPGLLPFHINPFFVSIDRGAKIFLFGLAVTIIILAVSRNQQLQVPKAFLPLSLLGGAFLLSALQANVVPVALGYVGAYLLVLVFCLCAAQIEYVTGQLGRYACASLLTCGTVSAALGLYEYGFFQRLGPSGEAVIPLLLPPDLYARIGGPLGQSNLFALFMLLVLIGFCWWWVLWYEPGTGVLTSRLAFLPPLLSATVFFLTGSRSGLLVFVLVFGLLLWLVVKGRFLKDDPGGRRRLFQLFLVFGAGFLLMKVLPLLPGLLSVDVQDAGGAMTVSRSMSVSDGGVSARILLWTTALVVLFQNPWLGVGLDNFRFALADSQTIAHSKLGFLGYESLRHTNWAHNEVLQLLAEGGVLVLVPIVYLLARFCLWLVRMAKPETPQPLPAELFGALMVLAVLMHSLFSWPLRHPVILCWFALILGFWLAKRPGWTISLTGSRQAAMIGCAILIGLTVAAYGWQEYRIGHFLKTVRNLEDPAISVAQFEELCDNPFSEIKVLLTFVRGYTNYAVKQEDVELAEAMIPYAERLRDVQGAFWQWYDLARLYHLVGRDGEAAMAVQRSIDLQPWFPESWEFQHLMNQKEAARKTGRPLEDFQPKYSKEAAKQKLREAFLELRD